MKTLLQLVVFNTKGKLNPIHINLIILVMKTKKCFWGITEIKNGYYFKHPFCFNVI